MTEDLKTKEELVKKIIESGNPDLIGETLRIITFPDSKPHAVYYREEVRQDAIRLTHEQLQIFLDK